jgi:hypothetical protein
VANGRPAVDSAGADARTPALPGRYTSHLASAFARRSERVTNRLARFRPGRNAEVLADTEPALAKRDFLTPPSDRADPSDEPVSAGVGAEEDGEPDF